MSEVFYKTLEKEIACDLESLKKNISFLPFSNYETVIEINEFIVYEDWWLSNPDIVISKIKSKLGLCERIFARKSEVKRVDKLLADKFLNENHIYGTVKSKYKLGLFYENELVAIATFSPQRNLNVGRSSEIVRFCSKKGTTIVGGLDKIIKFYIKEFTPDHLMTYIDKDWGNGESFIKLGFKYVSDRNPIQFCIDKKTGKRISSVLESDRCDLKVWNRGSMKLEKYINNIKDS